MIRKPASEPPSGGPDALNSSTGIAPASSPCPRGHRRWQFLVPVLVLAHLLGIASAEVSLSRKEATRIGHKIWQNESGGTLAGLTAWNEGEDFASLGIGHFIWYVAGRPGPFEESFPRFVAYAKARRAALPPILQNPNDGHCPWNSRAEFIRDQSSKEMKELRKFLANTIDLQVAFLVDRMHTALPKMLAVASTDERARISNQFQRLANSAQGCYALIDYVNFKGEGVLLTERYRGQGWGLLQVLEGMPENGSGSSAPADFADSAARVLRERVKNSPPARNERRWLPGWLKRVASYR